jgi:phospholipid/cholesterol/gamma-HCH transport system ATP-binding protein
MPTAAAPIVVRDLTMAYGSFVIQRDLTFTVGRGDIFIIMGGSGCGKSTLLRHLIGLMPPAKGDVFINGENSSMVKTSGRQRQRLRSA